MSKRGTPILGAGLMVVSLALGGCAGMERSDGAADPVEPVNRAFFAFNDTLDRAFLAPVAHAYLRYVPEGIRDSVFNFFDNLAYPATAANQVLQGKLTRGVEDTARFVFNSTLGIGGLFDLATGFGLERHEEDFGQTLGAWGLGPGAYLELPLLGPSSVRDAIAIPVDALVGFTRHADRDLFLALEGGKIVDVRARADAAIKVRDEAAIDPYTFQREAYLQRRRSLIYDGNPPLEDLDLAP